MPYITDHKQKFDDLSHHLKNQDQLRKSANGGNSILFSYAPSEEQLYVKEAMSIFKSTADFIDVSDLLIKYIDEYGWDEFKQYYQDYKNTPHIVFRSNDDSKDLFDMIIQALESACKNGKIPILTRTGVLYGTGIENVNIMEHKSVIALKKPLVIFYPSKIEEDNLYFLNFKPASKYRCILVK